MNVKFFQLREIFDTRQVRDVLSVYIYNLHRIDFRRCQYAVAATGDVRLNPFAERCVREVRLVNGHRCRNSTFAGEIARIALAAVNMGVCLIQMT